jgi:hypothetical protein
VVVDNDDLADTPESLDRLEKMLDQNGVSPELRHRVMDERAARIGRALWEALGEAKCRAIREAQEERRVARRAEFEEEWRERCARDAAEAKKLRESRPSYYL